jgi:hypothetical protein
MIKRMIPIAVFVFTFFFFLLQVDPRLLYIAQSSPFIFDAHFAYNFLHYPGGFSWYLSALLTQCYRLSWAGALIITLFFTAIYWQTKTALQSAGIKRPYVIITVFPVVGLFAAYIEYVMPLTYAITMLAALICFNIYTFHSSPKAPFRAIRFSVLLIAMYYSFGTGAIIFTSLCFLFEMLEKKNIPMGILSILFMAVLPCIAAQFFFVILIPSAYYDVLGIRTVLLDAAHYPQLSPLMYSIYAYVPLVYIVWSFIRVNKAVTDRIVTNKKSQKQSLTISGFVSGTAGFLSQMALIALLMAVVAIYHFNKREKTDYQIEYFASQRMWGTIVSAITPLNIGRYSIVSQAQLFRALYYENRLLSDLYSYPQGMVGLSFEMVVGKMAKHYPMLMSDLNFDAGALNAAEYWAHEALAVKGERADILERLTLISILKKQKVSARKYVALLEKTPFRKKTAASYSKLIQTDSLIVRDSFLGQIQSRSPDKEYLCSDYYLELANLINIHNSNKMAIDILMARNLINNGISPIIDNLSFFRDGGYARLPRHIQEALVFQLMLAGSKDTAIGGYTLEESYFEQFNNFNRCMSSYGSDRASALRAMYEQYGATYWYYLASNGRPVYLKKQEPGNEKK